jgi:hypothetical protein
VEEEGEGLESELKEWYLPNCTIVWSSLFSKAWKNYHTLIHRNLIAHILARMDHVLILFSTVFLRSHFNMVHVCRHLTYTTLAYIFRQKILTYKGNICNYHSSAT